MRSLDDLMRALLILAAGIAAGYIWKTIEVIT